MTSNEPWARTERLELRRWAPEHLAELRALAVLPEIVRYVGDGRPWSESTVTTRHREVLEHWRRQGFGWLAAHDGTGAFVGLVAVTRRSGEDSGIGVPAVEVGYWVVPGAWGRGYGTEATGAVVAEVFARGHADLLVARYDPANTASGRLLAKLSFTPHHVVDGERPLAYTVLARPDR
ncbi:GNAT family N-acetyltransferase [Saccharothrix syringae]|uniref:N-acetyltransferase n=1 Tax=Saccharothrix syringae TaxID=103733 RepID=A0A5Q0GZN5_SACSY|nr:GNAT family N-acetyltransferase [Saccharothrix syringae]QFZ19020.1 N-acetyltransferase [Saccharothrix syringae]